MSLAIAHFAVGVTFGVAVLTATGLYKTKISTALPYVTGFFAMIPDFGKIIETGVIGFLFKTLHDSFLSNIFILHHAMDVYDSTDSHSFATVCLFVMVFHLGVMWALIYRLEN